MLGPYVLGALDEDERHQLGAHLAECRRCQEELTELMAAAGTLTSGETEDAPSDLWETIRNRVHRRPKDPPSERGK